MRRLVLTSAAALIALFLLFLENKCSYFLGQQELVAEVKPADGQPAEGSPEGTGPNAKPRTYDIVLKDVAGNVLATTPADLAEVKRRLGGNPARDQKAIPLVGEPKDEGLRIAVTVEPAVTEQDVRTRVQAVGFKRSNPPRDLFHI